MFSLNGCIHMILDTLANRIFWLAPLSHRGFSADSLLIEIAPSIVDRHPLWSHSIEAIIIILALHFFFKKRTTGKETGKPLSSGNSGHGRQ
ncbi:hypothetical protein BIU88_02265 [Chlorobaculum limnaeum]|uniref:Metal-dependent hydrolase n=1 Tax=Chlorobaculum limnaeum TaxID=274537 RepID=A0A1D8CY54_CHLLM|nr:hypothetical protein BIU88_02265 [Chlorobaculum limnaeum]